MLRKAENAGAFYKRTGIFYGKGNQRFRFFAFGFFPEPFLWVETGAAESATPAEGAEARTGAAAGAEIAGTVPCARSFALWFSHMT